MGGSGRIASAPDARIPAPRLEWGYRAALLLILALSFVLRLQNLGAVEHNVDHAYPIWQALTTLERGALPTTAQGTSVLFANPALTGYLFVLPVALTRSPIGAYLLVITLNTLAVWLAYRAARYLLPSPLLALCAAFLMAVNPWITEYSRTTWVQALLPFWVCLIFWLLVPVLLGQSQRPARRKFAALLALTAVSQSYLLAFVLALSVGLLLMIFRQSIRWRAVLLGSVIFTLAAGVYAYGLLAEPIAREQTLARLSEFGQGQSRLSDEAWSHALRLVSGREYAVARGIEAPVQDWALRHNLSEIVHVAVLLLLVAGMVSALYAASRPAGRPVALILLIWFLAPVLLMSYVSRPVHPFYLLLTLPAGHILAARGVGLLLDSMSFRNRVSTPALLLGILAVPVAILAGLNVLRYAEATLATPGVDGFSALPLQDGLALMRGSDLPAVVLADTDAWILNSFAGRLFPVDRDVNTARTTYLPAGGGLYLLWGDATPAPMQARALPPFVLADDSTIRRYLTEAPAADAVNIPGDAGIAFAGLEIETPPQAGHEAVILTRWRITELKAGRENWLFGPFVHVYDGAGQRVAIGDGSVVPGFQWRAGDVQLQRIRVQIPPDAAGPFRLMVGQYDGVHGLNVIFTLPDGTQSATLPIPPN